MRNVRETVCLMATVVVFVTCQAYGGIYDHFNNGQLDPAWNVSFQNASGWSYTESGTKLSIYDINTINSSQDYSSVLLNQSFPATGNFEIKSGFSWDSESMLSTMQNLSIRAFSGDRIVMRAGYSDGWITHNAEIYAKIEETLYTYDSPRDTLPYVGSVDLTMKRTNGTISILWNDQVILTGSCDSAIDRLAIQFDKDNYPGANFGVLSVDYITAVPEPATMLLLSVGSCWVLSRRKRI